MKGDAKTPLYASCSLTWLTSTLRLFVPKAKNRWSDKSFMELLQLLKEMLPKDNTLPGRNYDAKKILCPMGMDYEKIHACPNYCILYRNKYANYNQRLVVGKHGTNQRKVMLAML